MHRDVSSGEVVTRLGPNSQGNSTTRWSFAADQELFGGDLVRDRGVSSGLLGTVVAPRAPRRPGQRRAGIQGRVDVATGTTRPACGPRLGISAAHPSGYRRMAILN